AMPERAAEPVNSVQALAAALLALHFLGVTLDRSGGLALALGSGLLVELTAANFGLYAGFFAGALETTQGYVEGFVLFYFDGSHPGRTFINYRMVDAFRQKLARWRVGFQGLRILTPQGTECKAFSRKPLVGTRGGDYDSRLLLLPGQKGSYPC